MKTVNVRAVWCAFLVVLSTLFAMRAIAQHCPSFEITKERSLGGSRWDLRKIKSEMKTPMHDDLVLVTAHRGAWDFCPENTIEGAMLAMDKNLESIELDIRVSETGTPILSHDWDLRGEGIGVVGRRDNNLIYQRSDTNLVKRIKPDRYGMPSVDAKGNTIYLESLTHFLDVYVHRAQLMAGVEGRTIVKGATIVLDIKGGEPELKDVKYGDQYATFLATLDAIRNYQDEHRIDLSQALLYKINLKAIKDRETFLDDLREGGISFQPSLIFIIFPEDLKPEVKEGNLQRLHDYQANYPEYLVADWQNRYPGIVLEDYAAKDIAEHRGVGAFVSYNTFPEGGRRSDGTCSYDPNVGKECLNQPLQQYASSAIEYLLPAKPGKLQATSLTTDLFENAINYLNIIGRHNTTYIEANSRSGDVKSDPAKDATTKWRSPDKEYVIDGRCSNDQLLEKITGLCQAIPGIHVSKNGYFYNKNLPKLEASVADFSELTEADFKRGFTVSITVAYTPTTRPSIRSLLSISAPTGNTFVDVLLGSDGRSYLGKQADLGAPVHYITPMWDPRSPCTSPDRCKSETVYVTFLPNGQVRFDDFGVLKHVIARRVANWQAGMSNYGMPVTVYQPGDTPYRAPTVLPAFQNPKGIGLSSLPVAEYGGNNEFRNGDDPYPGVRATRVAIWHGGILGGDLKTGLEPAIVQDQRIHASGSIPDDVFKDDWKPCNSGQFQIDQPGDLKPNGTTQYTPTDLFTPCTPIARRN